MLPTTAARRPEPGLTDLRRRLAALVRLGLVAEVDLERARVRVDYDRAADGAPVQTGWLPWLAGLAGPDRSWRPLSVGEQVAVLSPDGDLAGGIVLGALYRADHPAPSASAAKHLVEYRDGAVVAYDAEAHELRAALPDGATVSIESSGGVSITGDVAVTGGLSVTGDIAADGDVSAEGDVTAEGDITADGDLTASGEVSDGKTLSAMRRVFDRHVHTMPPAGVPPGSPAEKM